jgi:hypothetical protein
LRTFSFVFTNSFHKTILKQNSNFKNSQCCLYWKTWELRAFSFVFINSFHKTILKQNSNFKNSQCYLYWKTWELRAVSSVFTNSFQKTILKQNSNVKNSQCCLYWKTWEVDVLASLGLRRCQHIIKRGLPRHCVGVEDTGSTKPVLIPRFHLCPSDPTISFKLRKRLFQSKSRLLWHSVRPKNTHLNVYPPSPDIFTMTHSQPSSYDVVFAITVRQWQCIENYVLMTSKIVYREVL